MGKRNAFLERTLLGKGNGGIGYYARDQGMQLDNMSNTVRIFLGTSLECTMPRSSFRPMDSEAIL